MAYDIENTFKQILLGIEEGDSLRSVLKREGMPNSSTFYEWIDNDKEKSIHYARACEKRADTMFEQILEIAYTPEQGITTKETERGLEITTADMLGHRKLKIDSIKWMLGKMQPKKYGDKAGIDIEESNEFKGFEIDEV